VQLLIVIALSADTIAVRVSRGTKSAPITEDKIDLRPPQFGSISQYNQPQTLSQVLGIHSQHHLLNPTVGSQQQQPFLYLGPLIFSHQTAQQARSLARADTQSHEENSYVLYRPTPEEEQEFVDLTPPPQEQEPNYYATKPRKLKKYQEEDKKSNTQKSVEDLKKRIKIAEIESDDDELETPVNQNSEEISKNIQENIRAARDLLTASSNVDYDIQESAPTSRLDFQMHGN
jgi:hypothetical protein